MTQLGRVAKPVVAETAAHMDHMVTAHIAPGLEAGVRTLGSQYAQGADRVTHIMLGPEKHARVRRGLRHVIHYIIIHSHRDKQISDNWQKHLSIFIAS